MPHILSGSISASYDYTSKSIMMYWLMNSLSTTASIDRIERTNDYKQDSKKEKERGNQQMG